MKMIWGTIRIVLILAGVKGQKRRAQMEGGDASLDSVQTPPLFGFGPTDVLLTIHLYVV